MPSTSTIFQEIGHVKPSIVKKRNQNGGKGSGRNHMGKTVENRRLIAVAERLTQKFSQKSPQKKQIRLHSRNVHRSTAHYKNPNATNARDLLNRRTKYTANLQSQPHGLQTLQGEGHRSAQNTKSEPRTAIVRARTRRIHYLKAEHRQSGHCRERERGRNRL